MLNIIFLYVFIPVVVLEFYKIIYWNKFSNLMYYKKIYNNVNFHFFNVYIFFFLNTLNNFHTNLFKYTLCVYIIILIFNFFFKKHYYSLFFFILVVLINMLYVKNNISYFILFVEIITLVLFFFIFLDFYKNNDKYKLSIVIFFFNNLIVFLFGIVLLTVLYLNFGTTNLTLVFLNIQYNERIKILFYLFFLSKLQQCFIFLLNLKYYSISTPKNIFLYKLPYFLIVWVYIFFIFSNFKLNILNSTSIFIIYTSVFLFNFLNYFNKWSDFFIFSTWLLLLFQIFLIIT